MVEKDNKIRIGVFPGSFNPPHKGHIELLNYLINNNYVDKIIVIPTGNYWDKSNLIDVDKRITMLKFYQSDKIIINDDLNDVAYTYLLMRRLKDRYKDACFSLIIGMDNLEKFHLWKNFEELLNNEIIVIPRKDYKCEVPYDIKVVDKYLENNISSTKIRELIKENRTDELDNYLDSNVKKYILENKLYND